MEHLVEFVIPKIKSDWENVAFLLGHDIANVKGIKEQFNDIGKCCREVLIYWLNTSHGPSPKTWSTLLTNLRRLEELTATVENIEWKLQEPSVAEKYV